MLKLEKGLNINENDLQIINAMENSIKIMEDENLDILWNDVKNCKFENHVIGKCGSYIYITRKCDNVRIAIIVAYDSKMKFNYMMLSRLEQDCKYYLGYGNRYAKQLYYHDEKEHIEAMKELYNSFPNDLKPEWITLEQIEEYEKNMIQ